MRNYHQKNNDLGTYASLASVWSKHPTGAHQGDYIHVGNDLYVWDELHHNWMLDTYTNTDSYLLLQQAGDLHLMGDLRVGGRMDICHHTRFKGDVTVEGNLDCHHLTGHDKGLFLSEEALRLAVPKPRKGDWALVGSQRHVQLWQCPNGHWEWVGDVDLGNTFNLDAYNIACGIVDDIARQGYVFGGVADPTTNPHEPLDHNVFYITSEPGVYVHFGNIDVQYISALMWTVNTNHNGQWTAKAILKEVFVNTDNIADGAVSLEKTTGIIPLVQEEASARAIADSVLQRQIDQIEGAMVRSISVNSGARKLPTMDGNINLVLPSGGGEADETIANQVSTNTGNIETLQQAVADLQEAQQGAVSRNIVLVQWWQSAEPTPGDSGTHWMQTPQRLLHVSDGTQWQDEQLREDAVYVDLSHDKILACDDELVLREIAGTRGERVVVVDYWSPILPQSGSLEHGQVAYDTTLKKLYTWDAEQVNWVEMDASKSSLYINASNNAAYRWDAAQGKMTQLAGTVIDSTLSPSSTNPVQNKKVYEAIHSIEEDINGLSYQWEIGDVPVVQDWDTVPLAGAAVGDLWKDGEYLKWYDGSSWRIFNNPKIVMRSGVATPYLYIYGMGFSVLGSSSSEDEGESGGGGGSTPIDIDEELQRIVEQLGEIVDDFACHDDLGRTKGIAAAEDGGDEEGLPMYHTIDDNEDQFRIGTTYLYKESDGEGGFTFKPVWYIGNDTWVYADGTVVEI